jgi:hypothetical protein
MVFYLTAVVTEPEEEGAEELGELAHESKLLAEYKARAAKEDVGSDAYVRLLYFLLSANVARLTKRVANMSN